LKQFFHVKASSKIAKLQDLLDFGCTLGYAAKVLGVQEDKAFVVAYLCGFLCKNNKEIPKTVGETTTDYYRDYE